MTNRIKLVSINIWLFFLACIFMPGLWGCSREASDKVIAADVGQEMAEETQTAAKERKEETTDRTLLYTTAYLETIHELEQLYGACVFKLVDFNRDGKKELLTVYCDEEYYFSVFEETDGEVCEIISDAVSTDGMEKKAAIGIETMRSGQIYLIVQPNAGLNRVFGYDEDVFSLLCELGLNTYNDEQKSADEMRELRRNWLSGSIMNIDLGRLKKKEKLPGIETESDEVNEVLSEAELLEGIQAESPDMIHSRLYGEFGGKGYPGLAAVCIDEENRYAEIWYADADGTSLLYTFTQNPVEDVRLLKLETDDGCALGATIIWRNMQEGGTTAVIIGLGEFNQEIMFEGENYKLTAAVKNSTAYEYEDEMPLGNGESNWAYHYGNIIYENGAFSDHQE